MDTITNSYAAGLFDGEGTITLQIRKSNSQFRFPVVSVSSTTLSLLEFLKETYGGHISTHKTYQSHHKQSWSWKIVNDKAIDFLHQIIPYLKEPEKIRRSNLILNKFKQTTIRNGKYSFEQIAKKLAFENEFFHPSIDCSSLPMSL